jgi:Ribosome inactivating protein
MALAPVDILGDEKFDFDSYSIPSAQQYDDMVQWLRGRFGDYNSSQSGDQQFFRVDSYLGMNGGSIQLYFLKSNLYLVGWTIDEGTGYVTVEDPQHPIPVPSGMATRGRLKLTYGKGESGKDVNEEVFSREKMEQHLGHLYGRLKKIEKAGKATADDLRIAKFSLDAIARMTAEMARFDVFRQQLSEHWDDDGWRQDSPVTAQVGGQPYNVPLFRLAIDKWGDLSDVARGTKTDLRIDNMAITQEQAKAILGDAGVKTHPR